jgi:hypothetical protein
MCFKCQNYEKRWALHKNDISKIINILKNASFYNCHKLKLIFEHFIAGSNFVSLYLWVLLFKILFVIRGIGILTRLPLTRSNLNLRRMCTKLFCKGVSYNINSMLSCTQFI